ncbi:MAG: serine/threonine protein kinase, partial [Deltaproteobacteria bacterium]
GDLLVDRYLLGTCIGKGGFGRVYEAQDRLAGDRVAVKLLRIDGDPATGPHWARCRSELNALRRLRLPGVVRLRDDGELRGTDVNYFVVMDLVEGAYLFGPRRVYRWEEIEDRVRDLLEILARVHLAGVVHRDLKPANVLLTERGLPVLIDFGLAGGRPLSDDEVSGVAGTVRYVAPEQAAGLAVDGQADLYSLGVMLFEALTGDQPHGPLAPPELLRARRTVPARPVATVRPDVPPRVAAVIDALLSRDPDERPGSALDVLSMLGRHRRGLVPNAVRERLPVGRAATAANLHGIFAGPDHFFHLAEDGAAVLVERTGGWPDLVERELEAWTRAGLAWWRDDRLVIDGPAIRRLQQDLRLDIGEEVPSLSDDGRTLLQWARRAWPDARLDLIRSVTGWSVERLHRARRELETARLAWPLPGDRLGVRPVQLVARSPHEAACHMLLTTTRPLGSPLRLHHLQAAGADDSVVLQEAAAVVLHLRVQGRVSDALAVLEPALALARARHDDARERELLVQLVKVCLGRESRQAMDLALYALDRARIRGGDLDAVKKLVRTWRAVLDADPDRAAAELADVPSLHKDEELEVWRAAAEQAIAKARSRDAWAAAIDDLQSWADAGGAERRAKHLGWKGNLAYARSRFAEAADMHRQAAQQKRCLDARLASLLDAAWDLLDGGDHAQAVSVADDARALARRLGLPVYEAQAITILRAAAYRRGDPLEPDPTLVEAATLIGTWNRAVLLQTEAAIAWRLGEARVAASLATRAAEDFERAGLAAGARLGRALAFRLGVGGVAEGVSLVQLALPGAVPGVDLQVLALVGRRQPDLIAPHLVRMRALARFRPCAEWSLRREILSIRECLEPSR